MTHATWLSAVFSVEKRHTHADFPLKKNQFQVYVLINTVSVLLHYRNRKNKFNIRVFCGVIPFRKSNEIIFVFVFLIDIQAARSHGHQLQRPLLWLAGVAQYSPAIGLGWPNTPACQMKEPVRFQACKHFSLTPTKGLCVR